MSEKKICGALSKGTGKPCRQPPMANGRCRYHGGLSTGPKDPTKLHGKQNAMTHGIYACGLHEHEKDTYGDITVGKLDDEIRLAKIHLQRMVKAQKMYEDQVAAGGDPLELDTLEEESIPGKGRGKKKTLKIKRIRRKNDFKPEITAQLRLISTLEIRRSQIESTNKGDTDMDSLREELQKTMAIFQKPMDIIDDPESDNTNAD